MLKIPHNTRKAFARHFIRQAFIELRFLPVSVKWEEAHSKFQKECLNLTFDNVVKSLSTQVSMKTDVESEEVQPVVNFSHEVQGLDLIDSKYGIAAQIRRDRIIINTTKYSSFENLWKVSLDCFELAQKIIGAGNILWLGIRKINIVGVEVKNGIYSGEGFNETFFTPLRQGMLDGSTVRQGETRYVLTENEITCIVKLSFHQLVNKNRYDVVFDIDLNQSFDTASDLMNVTRQAKSLNAQLFDVFCWVIAKDLRKSLDK